jgi:CheY-like chemotaxis protein
MDMFPKLQKLLLNALNQAAMDGGMLLGHELTVKESEFFIKEKKDFIKKMEDASFVVGVKSQEDYEGIFYLIITLRDAIVLGSLLLGVPPARVSEKKKLAILEPDDVDAFNEFTNQVIGSFNSVFKPALPKKVHLKLLESSKFIPGSDEVNEEQPFPDGEYFHCGVEMGIPQQDLDQFHILLPKSLASFYDLQENREDSAFDGESDVFLEAPPESSAVPLKHTVLILDDNGEDRLFLQEALTVNDIIAKSAPLDADLGDFFGEGPVKAVLLGTTDLDDREISICIKIKAMVKGGPVPVIMCGSEWTRAAVLKALKYGASDIIIKPCSESELKGRLSRFLNAA